MIRYDTTELSDGSAEERVQYALEQIEGAQRLLGAAATNLSPVIGLVREHQRTMALYDLVHRFWHRIEGKLRSSRGRLQLDGLNEAARQQRLAEIAGVR
jgi:hypothetical protein